MNKVDKLLHEVEGLPTAEKWRFVKLVLRSLEQEQTSAVAPSDWHEFLQETYGSLRDTPLERAPQGEYEEREPLE